MPELGLVDFTKADFSIFDASGKTVIGHAHYGLTDSDSRAILRGENRYFAGDYDLEEDVLHIGTPGTVPTLVSFEHSFFNRDGSPLIVERASIQSGDSLCVRYKHGRADSESAVLDFPTDTYAGASLLIPIEYGVRTNPRETILLHAFACAPRPRVLKIEAYARPGARAAKFGSDALAVDVRPKLGWWDILIRPFIPTARAWFDPTDGFVYLGGKIQRYYRGPSVELVRVQNRAAGEAEKASPAAPRE